MPHLHTKPGEHDHTISAYIIRTDLGEPRIMMHFHKKLHKYIQYGGHIETTETPWQAIVHELREESGYALSQLRILQPRDRIKQLIGAVLHPVMIYHNTHHFDETHFHTDGAYAFVTDQPPLHPVADNETDDVLLLTRTELLELAPEKTFESVRTPALYALDTCLTQWEHVDTADFLK